MPELPEPWNEGQPCVLLSRCPSVQACGTAVPTAQITSLLVLPLLGHLSFISFNSKLILAIVPL